MKFGVDSRIYDVFGFKCDVVNDLNGMIEIMDYILLKNNVCKSHGLEHAVRVMNHVYEGIQSWNTEVEENKCWIPKMLIDNDNTKCLLLAGLLHDIDDHKFFPDNKNYENLRVLMATHDFDDKYVCDDDGNIIGDNMIDRVVKMVDLVSCSKNGDTIPEYLIEYGMEWMLIPRYADRLEAIGEEGIRRCYEYTLTIGRPLFTDNTVRVRTLHELWEVASQERFDRYSNGGVKSETMIDHYYDKLLRLCDFAVPITYFDEECEKRRQVMIEYILHFGITGELRSPVTSTR